MSASDVLMVASGIYRRIDRHGVLRSGDYGGIVFFGFEDARSGLARMIDLCRPKESELTTTAPEQSR